jgi:hypothetical protein
MGKRAGIGFVREKSPKAYTARDPYEKLERS